MTVNQRDVYLLLHPFDQTVEKHPFIVLSSSESNQHESTFVAVMITSSDLYRNDYSFELNDDMFEKPLAKKGSHVRMHLLTLYLNDEIIGIKINTMKALYFKQLMATIGELVFEYQFKPLIV